LLLAQGRLKFKTGSYIDALFAELQRIDGTRSSSKKDDRGDAIAQVAAVYRIYSTESGKKQTSEDADEVERMQRKAALLAETQRYFSGSNYTPPPKVEQTAPQQPTRHFKQGGSFAILPEGMRGAPSRSR